MPNKIKWSRLLVILVFAGIFGSLIVSDFMLKKDYDRIDKSDVYWTFQEIFSAPYSHLKINGGNLSHLIFNPSARPSVRVLKAWESYQANDVKTHVKNDTLFIDFPQTFKSLFDRDQMAGQTSLRIFGPVLHSVTVTNSNLLLEKFDGRDLNIDLSGKSSFEIETLQREMGKMKILSADSSQLELELSPDVPGNREFRVAALKARLEGHSLLLTGHARIDSLDLSINDFSGFESSGATWNKQSGR